MRARRHRSLIDPKSPGRYARMIRSIVFSSRWLRAQLIWDTSTNRVALSRQRLDPDHQAPPLRRYHVTHQWRCRLMLAVGNRGGHRGVGLLDRVAGLPGAGGHTPQSMGRSGYAPWTMGSPSSTNRLGTKSSADAVISCM